MAGRDKKSAPRPTDPPGNEVVGDQLNQDPPPGRALLTRAYLSFAQCAEILLPNNGQSVNALAKKCCVKSEVLKHHLFVVLRRFHGFDVVEYRGGGKHPPVRLTDEGRKLAYRARLILDVAESVRNYRRDQSPVFRIGGFNAAFRSVIAERLHRLKLKINVELVDLQPRDQITNLVLAGAVDVCVDWVPEGEKHPAELNPALVTQRSKKTYEFVAVASSETDGKFSARTFAAVSELGVYDKPLILTYSDVEALVTSRQMSADTHYVSCPNVASALALVRLDVGIGILPEIENFYSQGVLVARFKCPILGREQLITFCPETVLGARRKIENDPLVRFFDMAKG